MKILLFLGSPRKKGNSEILADAVARGARKAGADCEVIRLATLDIHPCLGCGGCEKEGNCVIQDDMQGLYKSIAAADRIVVASPIYFYGVTAQTKAFIDRCQALWSRKYLLKMKRPGGEERKGYYLGVAATRGERIFEGAILSVTYGLDAMDFSYAGELAVRGLDRRGAAKEKEGLLHEAEAFGRQIASDEG